MVLRMRCVKHFGEGEALLPMIEAMEKRCRAPEGAKLIELMRSHAPVWLAQLPSVLKLEEREALQREIFGASRERMVREGCELLEALSKDRPVDSGAGGSSLERSRHAGLSQLAGAP